MPDPKSPLIESDQQSAGNMLYRVGLALLVIYLALIAATLFPLKIVDTAWQLRLIRSLVNNGTVAIIGLSLISLAPTIHPTDKMRRRRLRIANFAAILSMIYLIIVPLQAVAIWQGLSAFDNAQTRQFAAAKEKIEQIRKAVNESKSTPELQERLQAIPGPQLPPLDTDRPIDTVRPQLLALLETAQGQLRQRVAKAGLSGDRMQQLIQESFRIAVSALVISTAIACCSVWPGGTRSLFDGWMRLFETISAALFGWTRLGSRRQGNRSANQEYFEQISGSGPRKPGDR